MQQHKDGSPCKLSEITPENIKPIIVNKKKISPILTQFDIYAPLIAKSAKPGQFIMIWSSENGERIPLTISDTNPEKGTITIIFQEVGAGTIELGRLNEGDTILSLSGPLGKPTEIEKYGTAVVIGGGIGTAIARPVAVALKKAGNKLITIIGAREQSLIILEEELKPFSDELIITTDDGSYGRKGLVVDPLKELLEKGEVDIVFAIGPLPMMKAVADTTKPFGVKTIVSLDPIMVDGTGMCGGCRVTVGGKTQFTCVDGPDFDAHEVDWQELRNRKSFYFEQEKKAKEESLAGGKA